MATMQAKWGKFETLFVLTLIGALALFLLAILEGMRVEVEEASVQAEAAALRVELLDILAHRESRGGLLPPGNNPVQWTGRVPKDYLGELEAAPEAKGAWYFNRATGLLAYRYQRGGEARFRLTLGVSERGAPARLAGVGLIRLENTR